jgi:hypothetical protein
MGWMDDVASVAGSVYDGACGVGNAVSNGVTSAENAVTNGVHGAEDWVDKEAHAVAGSVADVPVVGAVANSMADQVAMTAQVAGGVVGGATTLVGGIVNANAHPLDTWAGVAAMAEHTPGPLGDALRMGENAVDVARGKESVGDALNNSFNPLKKAEDDQAFWGNVVNKVAEPYKQSYDDPGGPRYGEMVGRGAFDSGSLLLGAGEAGAAAKGAEGAAVAADAAKAATVAADAGRVAEGPSVAADAAKFGTGRRPTHADESGFANCRRTAPSIRKAESDRRGADDARPENGVLTRVRIRARLPRALAVFLHARPPRFPPVGALGALGGSLSEIRPCSPRRPLRLCGSSGLPPPARLSRQAAGSVRFELRRPFEHSTPGAMSPPGNGAPGRVTMTASSRYSESLRLDMRCSWSTMARRRASAR